jgi:hypothetical protein
MATEVNKGEQLGFATAMASSIKFLLSKASKRLNWDLRMSQPGLLSSGRQHDPSIAVSQTLAP